MATKRRIYCKFCNYFCYSPDDFVSHLEKKHDELIPKDQTPWQFSYFLRTGKNHGSCIICHKDTKWNEKTHKYNRFCDNPKCKEKYREIFKNRMIGKYGKTHLLNDPEQQKKMLSHRKISGEYIWRDHIHKSLYTGTYEESFLEFLDEVMNFDPADIMCPSPHTYYYEYNGKRHFYIPDFFIPSLQLEIEIKDGGDNPNMHHKIQDVDKVKEKLKDDVMKSNQFNYLKITNKDNKKFLDYLILAKEQNEDKNEKPIFMVESEEDFSEGEVVTESAGELFEEVHWDTLLTRPEIYGNKNVTMYHYANVKKDVVKPITVNAGNKLAKPRFSSWWTPQRSNSAWVLSNVLFSKFKDKKWKDITWTIESVTDNCTTYKAPITVIGESFFNENEKLIKSIDVYEHEKTFNGKDLGRGNEYSVDEFTCDFPVKPDKVRRVEWDDIRKFIKIVPDEELTKYAKDINDMRLRNKHFQDLVHEKKPWLYWDFEVSNDIRVKYCKEHDIDFKVDEEYYRFTYNGVGIYEALKQNVNSETWKKLIKSSNFTWLPKPENYPKTNISYFTREGRDMFLKKVLPICEKYLGNDIEFSKVKNIKHIVYKDKYQIIVDTSLVAESEDDDTQRGMNATIIYEAVYDKEEIENE